MITESQHRTYQFIKTFIEDNAYAPTIAEITKGLGVQSRSYIHRNIQAIADAGLIRVIPNRQRNIELTSSSFEQNETEVIPLVGRIAAGEPIEALANQQAINFSALLAGDDRYLLEVKGESMLGDNICDGDLVLCQKAQTARNGQIAVVLIDQEEATLKRIYHDSNKKHVWLKSSNPTYPEMMFTADRVQIQGIYLGLVRIAQANF